MYKYVLISEISSHFYNFILLLSYTLMIFAFVKF